MRAPSWDVIVIGGGTAGSVCAALLAQNGWKVLLAEGGTYSRSRLADTLCPATVRRLRFLTGCDLTVGELSVPCRGVVAKWGARERQVTDYELNTGSLGWTVARPETDRMLFELARRAGACAREGWRRIKFTPDSFGEFQEVTFATKLGCRAEKARMVVDATGRVAPLRNGYHLFFDRQLAFATSLQQSGEKLQGFLWIESTAAGWWYINAVPRGRVQLVFLTNGVPIGRGPGARAKFFQDEFERSVMLKELTTLRSSLTHISVYDARLSVTVGIGNESLFHAGDAAATTDPLSGRGWLRALDSAKAAAAAASQALTAKNCEAITLFREKSIDAFTQHVKVRKELNAELGVNYTFVRQTSPLANPI
jgi:flavin-dependent dehydrogenase